MRMLYCCFEEVRNFMKKRNVNVDLLKIFCCLAVIMLHVSAEHLYEVDYGSFTSFVLNIGHGITRFAVTVFFMISGMLYFSDERTITVDEKYIKKLLKFVLIYFVYAIGYAFCALFFAHSLNGNGIAVVGKVLDHALTSPKYHLWYVPAYVGALAVIPLIKLMLERAENDKKLMEYILFFAAMTHFMNSLYSFDIDIITTISQIIGKFQMDMVAGWAGILILGHYLEKYPLAHYRLISIISVGLFALSLFASYFCKGAIDTSFYSNLTLQTTLFAASIFMCFVNNRNIVLSERSADLIRKISSLTLGIYLIHPFFLNVFEVFGFNAIMFNPLLAIPLVTVIAFVVTLLIVKLMKFVPVVKELC